MPTKPTKPKLAPAFTEPTATPSPLCGPVANHDRLVLTGSPGSGKTTFMRHFSLCFAQRALQPKAALPKGLKHWPEDAPRFLVPITIELRRFARSLPRELPPEKQPGPRELWDFFTQTVLDGSKSRSGHKLTDLAELLETAVAEGYAVVFFEGLDEVPTGEQRNYVRRAVMAFAAADHFKASRVVLTCRARAYAQPNFALKSFTEVPLAGFTEVQIDAFIEAWYREIAPLNKLDPDEASRRAQDLCQRVRLPSLWELAPTPLLLTVMTHVHSCSLRR